MREPGDAGIPPDEVRSRAELEADRAGLLGLVSLRRHRLEKGQAPTSAAGLGIPDDPFTGKPFQLVATREGLELRSGGADSKAAPLVYRSRR